MSLDHQARRRRLGGRTARVITLVGSLLIGLVLSELTLRVALTERQADGGYWGPGAFVEDSDVGYHHTPGYRGEASRPGVFKTSVQISETGIRQSDVSEQLSYPRRLLVLGDSYPFGLGVDEEESFPALLRAPLNGLGIGVVNGAQTGYSLNQSVEWGLRLTETVRPDTVLLCVFLANDAPADYYGDQDRVDVRFGYRLSRGRWPRTAALDYLRTHSRLAMVVRRELDRLLGRWRQRDFYRTSVSNPDVILEAVLDPVRRLHRACSERDWRCGVLMVPRRNGRHRLADDFRAAVDDLGLVSIDLHGRLDPTQHYLRGDNHWSVEGHARVAVEANTFLGNSLLPASQPVSVQP